jgi:hypothetical protein
MGQAIQVEITVAGDAAIFDTDRSITGQDGTSYTSAEQAASDDRFPGRLASALFAQGDVASVWIASNAVVVRRPAGWDDPARNHAAQIIRDFFLYYASSE